MYWTFCLERGAPQRVNHAAVAVGDKIYSFGGYCGEEDMPTYIDVHCFDTNTLKWTKINYEEGRNCPLACYGHSVVAYNDLIYLWGGQNLHRARNILYCFDTKTLSWTKPTTSGAIPKPTDGHSACVIGDNMYIFGGFQEWNESFSQKSYSLNLTTFRWQKLKTIGPQPSKRDFHTASVIGSCIYIFGGRGSDNNDDENYPNDIMFLDTNTMKWVTPVCKGKIPVGRRSHSATVYNGEIYIIGGYDGISDNHLNDVHKYNPVTSEWTEMKVFGKKPHPRRRHCSVLVEDIIFLFGGSSYEDETSFFGRVQHLREHCDMHMLEFVPTLKNFSLMKIMDYQLDISCLPVTLQTEINWLTSLKRQPAFIHQKRNTDFIEMT